MKRYGGLDGIKDILDSLSSSMSGNDQRKPKGKLVKFVIIYQ